MRMSDRRERNPDSDFILQGRRTPILRRSLSDEYRQNSEKTTTTKNLSASLNLSGNSRRLSSKAKDDIQVPTIDDLERSLTRLKFDLKHLNESLSDNYGKSVVFADDTKYRAEHYRSPSRIERMQQDDDVDPELTKLLRREDKEAVSHLPPDDPKWFSDPQHLLTSMGKYPTLESQNISTRVVSPVDRGAGRFGVEIATKNVDGQLTALDLAANDTTFPVRLTAPHIVGVRSLLPSNIPVRNRDPARAKSPHDNRSRSLLRRSHESTPNWSSARQRRDSSPRSMWKPNSYHTNACGHPPPTLNKSKRGRSRSRSRPATALGIRDEGGVNGLMARGFSMTSHSTSSDSRTIRRQLHPLPSETELRFLRSADDIDTRRALVENSPYQQELARLRLERLRVEEEYLMQLKRESELERIRGPKPKWYSMKGPQFHYECNKNTALHKNKKCWAKTLRYRNDLLHLSNEFMHSIKT